ncbi:MAG TPA: hypothetical protein PKD83_10625 [Ignavibacteria bacterium]|nr:hypothetical protein [Ignavibacteria bacterium]
MKKFIPIFLTAFFLLVNCNFIFAQANSVELQDGGGNLLSSHNSIQAAYSTIPPSFSQPYIIEILAAYTGANEVFPITFGLKTGHSAANTITLRPDAGNTGEVISSSNSLGIFIIDDADYVILDGRPGGTGSAPDLEIRNTVTTGTNASTVSLINGGTHCIVRYIKSYNATQNATGPKNVVFRTSLSNPTGNSDNLVEECFVSGGRTGVSSDGTVANPNRNNTVRNNTIVDWGFTGIWFLNGSADMIIEGNTIYNTTGVSITNPSGINIQSTYDGYNLTIRNNKITNVVSTSTSTSLDVRGIYTVTAPGTGSVLNIYNNFIALNSNNNNARTTYGILTTGVTEIYTCNIYYNTIKIGGTQSGGVSGNIVSAGINKTSNQQGIVYNQKNNICINNRTGGTSGAVHTGFAYIENDTTGIINLDYNCYYADGSGAFNAYRNTTGYNILSAYQIDASPNEQNSRFKNVNFVSADDLHLTGASIQDPDLSARPISGITTDIDGNTRSSSFPYKGADESTAFVLKTLNLTLNLEACSPVQDTVTVSIRSSTFPYEIVETSKGNLNIPGTNVVNFAKAVDGISYYIVLQHRNSIETWSKSGGEIFSAGVLNYNFTTAASQAFGNNMILAGSNYSLYTGDVNQDEIVDAGDLSSIENGVLQGITGYNNNDLNCDDIVDASDLSYCENNVGIIAAKP